MLKPPFTYLGCKRRELDLIQQYEPKKFTRVCDLFGGSGVVSMIYSQRGYEVLYNELDKDLVDLLQTFANDKKASVVLEEFKQIPVDKETYQALHKKQDKTIAEQLYVRKHAYRGVVGSGIPNIDKNGKMKMFTEFELYEHAMRNITFTRYNAIDVLELCKDKPGTFIYLDPPYLSQGVVNQYVRVELKDIERVLEIIKDPTTKAKIMLHIGFEGYLYVHARDHIRHVYPFTFGCASSAGKKYYKKYQCIITNYTDFAEA